MSQATRIAFCSIWERTDSWIAIGKELAAAGRDVFHIVTPREYYDMAAAAGVPTDRILWLRRDEAAATPISREDLQLIGDYEAKTGLRLRHFLAMDRFLRVRPPEEQMQYAVYAFRRIHDFLDRHDIRLVSGEPSDTHDLIALLICRATGRHYAAPFDIRFPTQRFALWDSEIEGQPHITGAATPADVTEDELALAREVIDKIKSRQKMQFVANKTKAPGIGLGFFKRLARGTLYRALVRSKHDAHMYTLGSMFRDHRYHMIPINHRLNRLAWKSLFEQPVPGEKFVLYTLNYQPEHSVDVEAPYFMDAFAVVQNIARSLPVGVKLYVKEHPNALGLRGPKDLRRFKSLPGVRLIDPFVDSHTLLQSAELTVSLSGTVSLEAAIYGHRTALLSQIFIKNFSTVETLDQPWKVGEILNQPGRPHDPEADLRYVAWIISNSFPGTIVDRITDPIGIAPENIRKVTDGYLTLMRKLDSEPS